MGRKLKKLLLFLSISLFAISVCYATDYCEDSTMKVGYLMNESSGNLTDCSGQGHTGTEAGSHTYQQNDYYGGTSAIDFSGSTSNYFSTNVGSDLDTNYITIVVWVKTDNTCTKARFVDNTTGEGVYIRQQDSSSGYYQIIVNGSHGCSGNQPSGDWEHLAGVYNRFSNITLYVNGVSSCTGEGPDDYLNPSGSFYVGRAVAASEAFDGNLGELAAFNTSKSSTIVNDIYDHGLAGTFNSAAGEQVIKVNFL